MGAEASWQGVHSQKLFEIVGFSEIFMFRRKMLVKLKYLNLNPYSTGATIELYAFSNECIYPGCRPTFSQMSSMLQ